jgi:phosphopantothenoylcysteine decarboxylase/phosphopantothenate--cysteine ligase
MSLQGRRVVLGVSGGIAAYKAAVLARRLLEAGAEVRTVMTAAASEFLGPATLAAITGHRPVQSLADDPGSVSPHTDLGRWADVIVVAPATAATLSRLAHGLSEDALSATVLASRAPVVVAPAMHTEMWEQPSTVRNIATLRADGVVVVGPADGPLAGGDVGPGRMVEPEEIAAALDGLLAGPLDGVRVLVTAGGTREPIDPVRYVGNRSSGKMGHAIADEAARRGATVTLVTTSELTTNPSVRRIQVETATEMDDAVRDVDTDVAVMAAAVADFRPADRSSSKLSRSDGPPEIRLEPTPDVLAGVADRDPKPYLVGFAAETGSLERALDKARRKRVDLLVANDVSAEGSGFGVDTNEISLIRPDGRVDEWPLLPKTEVASRLWDVVAGDLGPVGTDG